MFSLEWPLFNPFQDREIGEFYLVQDHSAKDFEAPNLWTGRSGVINVAIGYPHQTSSFEIHKLIVLIL